MVPLFSPIITIAFFVQYVVRVRKIRSMAIMMLYIIGIILISLDAIANQDL